jgi:CO/xanthine dehydrogenase Mo-binding subunit
MIPATLMNNPSLDRWVSFPTPGRVRVAVGKTEYGQGMLTGLAQIAAEELDVVFERLDVVNLETGASPDEGLTVGSMSTEMSGASIRAACAEARALFAAAAAEKLGCDAGELDVDDGAFMRGGAKTGMDYWSLAGEVDLARPPSEDVRAKAPKDHKLVGTSQPRIDLPPKVFGAAFLHDLSLPGMLHARVLRQPGPRALLARLDEAAVRRAAGGAIDIVRDGQFTGFVSESEPAVAAAIAAAEGLAEWEGAQDLSPALSETESLKSLPHESFPSGAPAPGESNRRRMTASYGRPYIAHGSMGPSCGVAEMKDGVLTVWTHAQGVYPLRMMLARVCALAPGRRHLWAQRLGRRGDRRRGDRRPPTGQADPGALAARGRVRARAARHRHAHRSRRRTGRERTIGRLHRRHLERLAYGRAWPLPGRGLSRTRTAAADDPADRAWRHAFQRRCAERDPVLRHPRSSVHGACGERAGANVLPTRVGWAGEHLCRRMLHRRTG